MKKRAGKNRIIPIPECARELFEYFANKGTELIIDGYKGNLTPNNFRKREYAKLMERLNITGKTPHSTRHTFISKAVASDMRTEILQKIVGHADYSTTANVYVHSNADELVNAAAKLFIR